MSANIEGFQNGILSLLIHDDRAGDIARITYPTFTSNISYDLCNFPEADIRCDKDTLAFVPANKTITYKGGSVYQNNQILFGLRDIFTLPNLQFTYIRQNGTSLQFSVSRNNTLLGIIALRFKSRVP
jgi:hypothetical protein